MKESQDDSLNMGIEKEEQLRDDELSVGNQDTEINPEVKETDYYEEVKEQEGKRLDHKSKKPLLFILSIFLCLIILATIMIEGKNYDSDSIENTSGGDETTNKNSEPEIRNSTSSAAIQEGDLITADNEEQERLNALAEESRVYCIISSSPYFKDVNSKGSLFISNPKESKYYTQVIIETDDNKEMYVSPLLAPDEKIESDYLTNKDFEQGSYHCYAYFNYYASEESSSYLGSMCAEINVVID